MAPKLGQIWIQKRCLTLVKTQTYHILLFILIWFFFKKFLHFNWSNYVKWDDWTCSTPSSLIPSLCALVEWSERVRFLLFSNIFLPTTACLDLTTQRNDSIPALILLLFCSIETINALGSQLTYDDIFLQHKSVCIVCRPLCSTKLDPGGRTSRKLLGSNLGPRTSVCYRLRSPESIQITLIHSQTRRVPADPLPALRPEGASDFPAPAHFAALFPGSFESWSTVWPISRLCRIPGSTVAHFPALSNPREYCVAHFPALSKQGILCGPFLRSGVSPRDTVVVMTNSAMFLIVLTGLYFDDALKWMSKKTWTARVSLNLLKWEMAVWKTKTIVSLSIYLIN